MENDILLSSQPLSPLLDQLPQSKIWQLQRKKTLLEQLCQVIDPYQKLDPQHLSTLHQLGLQAEDHPNPFTLTNQLLLLLDQTTAELEALEKLFHEI